MALWPHRVRGILMSNVRPCQCAVWFIPRSRAAASGAQMPANAAAPAPLHRAAIVSGCKPKFASFRTKKEKFALFSQWSLNAKPWASGLWGANIFPGCCQPSHQARAALVALHGPLSTSPLYPLHRALSWRHSYCWNQHRIQEVISVLN